MTTHSNASDTNLDITALTFTRRAWVAAGPHLLYALVSDVTRVGQWSPTADTVQYDANAGAWVGAWFSGRNRRDGNEWVTRSQVILADAGRRFAFVVGGAEDGIVRWDWDFTAQDNGTVVQQSWRILRHDPVLGATASDLLALRDFMADSAETTLINLAAWIAQSTDVR